MPNDSALCLLESRPAVFSCPMFQVCVFSNISLEKSEVARNVGWKNLYIFVESLSNFR
jgi:hypothetical protein